MRILQKFTVLAVTALLPVCLATKIHAAGDFIPAPERDWPSAGYFGTFDQASLQRGLRVYTENCASCHSMDLLSYRDLEFLGYSPEQVKAYAAQFEVLSEPNEDGERELVPASPSDRFVSPYANEQEARALNGGALPPDFSLIVKARNFGKGNMGLNFYDMLRGRGYASGADYIYALLTGYLEVPPADFALAEGQYYNIYYPGHAIAMAPPLYETEDFADGTLGTIEQQARDVASFLKWASEPRLEERRKMGIKVLLFLAAFFVILLLLKRRVWQDVH